MTVDPDMTLYEYARAILPEGWRLVIDAEAVGPGVVLVRHDLKTYTLHPESRRVTLRQNTEQGRLLPPNHGGKS